MIKPDKSLKTIEFAYQTLQFLGVWLSTEVTVNRSYISNETVQLNFNISGKRYLLCVSNDDTMECEIWHSHTKGNYLVKEKYRDTDIIRGKFIKE